MSTGYPSPNPSPSRGRVAKDTDGAEGTGPSEGHVLEDALLDSTINQADRVQSPSAVVGLASPNQKAKKYYAGQSDSPSKGDARKGKVKGSDEDADMARYFDAAMHKAKVEGLDLFAAAPQPSFRSVTPLLVNPHGRVSGMVQSLTPNRASRINSCLPPDYFERPAWKKSTVPAPFTPWSAWGVKSEEDRRSLETVARQRRCNVIDGSLAKRIAPRKGCVDQRPDSVDFEEFSRPQSTTRPHSRATSTRSRPVSRVSGRNSRRR
mmetsp:Transcript_61839/g.109826  ORF Transcript_61839/g.109826 Transcript_61839/m.109826 type:complete len:264 (-) Transcript_61839:241-1032(-)